jgi:plasmid rolling circle replication initiator protein Rep
MSTVTHADQNATPTPIPHPYIEELRKRKAESIGIIKAYQQDIAYSKKMQRIRDCAGILILNGKLNQDTGEIIQAPITTRFCGDPYCPVCQWRRWWKWCCHLKRAIPRIMVQNPTALPYMLTLTVRNCAVTEIRQTVTAMSKAWTRLLKRREFAAVTGWVRTIEITKADDDTAHPHFHCLLLVDTTEPIDWQRAWQMSLGVPYAPAVQAELVIRDAGISNTLKYMVKLSDDLTADQEWFLTLVEQTARTHRIASGGLLRGVMRQHKKASDNSVLLDRTDHVHVMKWRWDEERGDYVLHT